VSNCITVLHFVQIALTVAEIWRFWIFQDGVVSKFRILTVGRVTSDELRNRTKFSRNRSNRG